MRMPKRETVFIKAVLFFFAAVLLVGCSIESKLNREYRGKSFSEVMIVKGAPTNIENLVGGGTLRTYHKQVMLKETPINTGQFQYDSFNAPKVLKSEITQFKVSNEGIVLEIKYSCEYSK
jgi:hypothetical protein